MHTDSQLRVVRACIVALIMTASWGQRTPAQAVKVVNIIPLKLSSETMDNSEPTLAVRPGTPTDLAASVHIWDKRWCNGADPLSGYFVSTDGGENWTFLCALPRRSTTPYDPTLRFSGDGKTLYIGYLLGNQFWLHAIDDFTHPESLRTIVEPAPSTKEIYDQPQVLAFPGASSKRVVIAMSGESGKSTEESAKCRVHLHVATSPTSAASFKTNCVGERPWLDNPYAVRIATHRSGRVYVAYLHTRRDSAGWDVVLQSGILGSSSPKLDDLKEPSSARSKPCDIGDGLLGVRIEPCRIMSSQEEKEPIAEFGWETPFPSELSVAVHPTNDQEVYVAWGDSMHTGGPTVTLHVRKSTDGGKTWPKVDLFTVPNATNPALAVDSKGRLGFLYQELVGSGPFNWQTKLCITTFCNSPSPGATSLVLADTPAGTTKPQHDPYLGDYVSLTAAGDSFYGIFSARNDPTDVTFPHGVKYLRACSGGSLRNNSGGTVDPSADPFFFRVQPDLAAAVPASTKPAC